MKKFLNFNRVLCLSPHPDDVEYSMAGTIISNPDTHFDILCLTQGGDCDKTTGIDRIQEVINSWQSTNITNYSLHFSKVKFLKEKGIDEWVNWIEINFLNVNDYDCIFTTSDMDSHFEHKITCEIGYPCTRVSKISLIEYYSPSTLETWVPNVFVDVSNVYNIKLNMLQNFKTQLHRSYFQPSVLDAFHNNFRCSKRNIHFIEQFKFKQIFI